MMYPKPTHMKTRSISFKGLKHLEACRFFDRADEVMAKKLGIKASVLDDETRRE